MEGQRPSKKTWFSADDLSEAKAQSYIVIGKCTRQRVMGPYNVDTQRGPTPSVYIHCIASNGVERSRDQKHNGGMRDLSRDLSGISLGSLLVLDPWACVPSIEFSLWSAPGSLWDLSGISLGSLFLLARLGSEAQ